MLGRRACLKPRKPSWLLLCAVLSSALLGTPLFAKTLEGRVVHVSDGDTLTLRTAERKLVKIRLGQIDAPEKDQPYGKQSWQSLLMLVQQQNVMVEIESVDQYGRSVAKLMLGDLDVNLEQVRRGMAWFYTEFGRDAQYRAAQQDAQAGKLGLWVDHAPIPPWQWRAAGRVRGGQVTAMPPSAAQAVPVPTFQCDGRMYCTQMTSCEEAKFFLKHCPNVKMDGNRDGRPCEQQWCK